MERDKKFPAKEILVGLATAGIVYEASRYGLTRKARVEAGTRDDWECQGVDGEPCVYESLLGEPARFSDGYMVTLAHYKETHHLSGSGYSDPDPENARCLCGVCHATEEHDRGNDWGAEKLLDMGIYVKKDVREGKVEQQYLTLEDALNLRERARDSEFRKMEEKQKIKDEKKLKKVRLELASVRGTRL